jgi:hypothetical protein
MSALLNHRLNLTPWQENTHWALNGYQKESKERISSANIAKPVIRQSTIG